MIHLGCWAHCRRYFVEAEATIPEAARNPEQLGNAVHRGHWRVVCRRVESQGQNTSGTSAASRCAQPASAAKDRGTAAQAAARRRAWQPAGQGTALPVSPVAEIDSLCREWRLADRQQPVRERHPPVRRRPPQLAVRRFRGRGPASANLYSLVEICKANRIDPYTYLVTLFGKLPLAKTADDFDALLPWRISALTKWLNARIGPGASLMLRSSHTLLFAVCRRNRLRRAIGVRLGEVLTHPRMRFDPTKGGRESPAHPLHRLSWARERWRLARSGSQAIASSTFSKAMSRIWATSGNTSCVPDDIAAST